jgi:CO/xanthine dehydrogenase FAD-binding subunit
MLPDFDLFRPRDLPEALALLADHAPDAMPLAGGTNLIVEMRDGERSPAKLVDVSRLRELRGVRRDDGHIVVGGATTIAELLADPLVAEHGRPLRQAAALLGNPLVRSRATVGGNLANASPAADTAPPLLALGAEVELASRSGTRRMPLQDFMVGVNSTRLRPDELVAAVRWPVPGRCAAGFYKIGLRKADACSVINAAAMVICDHGGLCREARIAIGAAAPRPVRAKLAEEALQGRPLDSRIIEEAARLAVEATQPIDDIRGSASYRRRMTELIVRRLLMQAAEAQKQQEARR